LDTNDRIIDLKTSSRNPSAVEPDYRFQIAAYAQLTHGTNGRARLDTLVKTKTPAIVTQKFAITSQDVLATQKLYPLALQAMRSEVHMPNRLSLSCSRRNYSDWRHCEREWGGEAL
jgi:hypothetical protein